MEAVHASQVSPYVASDHPSPPTQRCARGPWMGRPTKATRSDAKTSFARREETRRYAPCISGECRLRSEDRDRQTDRRVTGGRRGWRRRLCSVTFWPKTYSIDNSNLEVGHVPGRVEVAGVLAAAAQTAGWYACHRGRKDEHHPGRKPLQGSAATISQAGLQARAGSPDPLRGTCKSPSGIHRRDCNKHPLPSASKCVRAERDTDRYQHFRIVSSL
jgi:hypothetical protein